MAAVENKTFATIRRDALDQWLSGKRIVITDKGGGIRSMDMRKSMECSLQDRQDGIHINFLCSLRDFSMHIFDLLDSNSCDSVIINTQPEKGDVKHFLFRYYGRIFLIASELIADFRLLYKIIYPEVKTDQEIVKALTGLGIDVITIMKYANNLFKHKSNFHSCNYHLPVHFDDSGEKHPFQNPIDEKLDPDDLKDRKYDGIIVPKLSSILATLLQCYEYFENEFKNDANYKKLIAAYGVPEKVTQSPEITS